ncbi:MAG: ABC transporter ATP-binding protein [Caldilineae bacterium]|nr:ABC transporter ATP-binding protein [Chloroflexota bacterium]MCB9176007.1 ABC transporter ATP-binding protein [Caldilineae bacterium]
MTSNTKDRETLLDVRGLKTYFFTEDGVVKAVDGVDITVRRGETLGIVGESGCGKSVTMFSVMRLIGQPGEVVEGEILFDGRNLRTIPEGEMQDLRGNRISMIFQQPLSSLNPVFRIGDQISEVFEIHEGISRDEGRKRAVDMLRLVGIPDPERRAQAFPHEISGGQAQRVMIAMALATDPELLIADEPTTALDVTIQAQILDLMRDLRTRSNTSIIFITHDLGVVAEMAENVAVMYAGQIVEFADVDTIFKHPSMPYTVGLIESIPVLGHHRDRLAVIPGTVPSLVDLPPGCRFAGRCVARIEHELTICNERNPELLPVEEGHLVRCWLYHDHPPTGYKATLATGRAQEEASRHWTRDAGAMA